MTRVLLAPPGLDEHRGVGDARGANSCIRSWTFLFGAVRGRPAAR
jgi:hypothetical protein